MESHKHIPLAPGVIANVSASASPETIAATQAARLAAPLRWHYGPTKTDPDPGKMWCYDCGKEVWWLYTEKPKGGHVCLGCGKTEPDET